jgi:hypothetical protein
MNFMLHATIAANHSPERSLEMKTIPVNQSDLALCEIKSERAEKMSRDECQVLMNWCGWQTESLWDGLSLQEILNVYRISAKWLIWEAWFEDEPSAAIEGWNQAVNPEHAITPQ